MLAPRRSSSRANWRSRPRSHASARSRGMRPANVFTSRGEPSPASFQMQSGCLRNFTTCGTDPSLCCRMPKLGHHLERAAASTAFRVTHQRVASELSDVTVIIKHDLVTATHYLAEGDQVGVLIRRHCSRAGRGGRGVGAQPHVVPLLLAQARRHPSDVIGEWTHAHRRCADDYRGPPLPVRRPLAVTCSTSGNVGLST